MAERLHVVIKGRVQGVGFRWATRRQAETLGLNGWVRNQWDGYVEAEFEGDRGALESMLAWCHKGPAFAQVEKVEASWEPEALQYDGFYIRG